MRPSPDQVGGRLFERPPPLRASPRDPAAIGPADAALLRAQALSDLEILDLTHAVAMFAWANRLMQTLGEPVTPAAQGNPL